VKPILKLRDSHRRGFWGYSIEGSLNEIERKLEDLKGVNKKELMEGFRAFKNI